jgi:hypothetical protein
MKFQAAFNEVCINLFYYMSFFYSIISLKVNYNKKKDWCSKQTWCYFHNNHANEFRLFVLSHKCKNQNVNVFLLNVNKKKIFFFFFY